MVSLYRAVHLAEAGQPSTSCTSSCWLMDPLLKLWFLGSIWHHLATQSCSARKAHGPGDNPKGETQLFKRPLSRVSSIFGLRPLLAVHGQTNPSVDVITNHLLRCVFVMLYVCNSGRDKNTEHIIKRSEGLRMIIPKLGFMFRSTVVPSMKDWSDSPMSQNDINQPLSHDIIQFVGFCCLFHRCALRALCCQLVAWRFSMPAATLGPCIALRFPSITGEKLWKTNIFRERKSNTRYKAFHALPKGEIRQTQSTALSKRSPLTSSKLTHPDWTGPGGTSLTLCLRA